MRPGRRLALTLALASALLLGCQPAARPEPGAIRVYASASLGAAFEELATAFTAEAGVEVRLHTAGTARLVMQLREGAPAEVFAAADEASLLAVLGPDAAPEALRVFASNELAILIAAANPHGIASLADLARPELRVALAGPEVPAGRYARRALARAGVELRSRSDEPSVSALLQKVALGELDATIVYRSDLQRTPAQLAGLPLPASLQPEIAYALAALPRARQPPCPDAEAFVDFVLSPRGQQILRDHGFAAPR